MAKVIRTSSDKDAQAQLEMCLYQLLDKARDTAWRYEYDKDTGRVVLQFDHHDQPDEP